MLPNRNIISLTDEDREYLNFIIETSSDLIARRAKILLALDVNNEYAYYPTIKEFAEQFGVSNNFIVKIKRYYANLGLEGAVFFQRATKKHIEDLDGVENLYDCVKKLVKEKGMSVAGAIETVKMLKTLYLTDDAVRELVLGDKAPTQEGKLARDAKIKELEEKYLTHKEDFSLEEVSALNRAIDEALGLIKIEKE